VDGALGSGGGEGREDLGLAVPREYVSRWGGVPEAHIGGHDKAQAAVKSLNYDDQDLASFMTLADIAAVQWRLVRQVWATRYLYRQEPSAMSPGAMVGCVWAKCLLRFLAIAGGEGDALDGSWVILPAAGHEGVSLGC
jgi:hypothetical protein